MYLEDINYCKKQLQYIFNDLFNGIEWNFASQISCIKNKNDINIDIDELSYPVILSDVNIFPELQYICFKFEVPIPVKNSFEYKRLCSAIIYTPLDNVFKLNSKLFNILINYFAIKYNVKNPMFYHTIFHVDYMLTKLNTYINNLSEYDYRLLYLTITFHDALYKAGKDNETIAINTVEDILLNNKLITEQEFSKIAKLINSTRIGTDFNEIKSIHLADILHDLVHLSFSESDYLSNTEKLWEENKSVVQSLDEFKYNRAEFLSNLLDNVNNNLFLTNYFKLFNKNAIININNECNSLFKYIKEN